MCVRAAHRRTHFAGDLIRDRPDDDLQGALGRPHETAGASVMGARMPLIAYNINLNTDRLEVARQIAAAIRHSSGGLRYVKAMGVMLEDRRIAGRARLRSLDVASHALRSSGSTSLKLRSR